MNGRKALGELENPNQPQPPSLKRSATKIQNTEGRRILLPLQPKPTNFFHSLCDSIFSEFMGVKGHPWILPSLLCFSLLCLPCFSQPSSSPASSIPSSPNNSPISPQIPGAASHGKVGEVAGATAASAVVVAGVFFCFRKFVARQRQRDKNESSFRREEAEVMHEEFKHRGTLKGLIVDDNGVEVLYLRKLEGGQLRNSFSKVLNIPNEEERGKIVESMVDRPRKSKRIQEIPLLHEPSDVIILEKEAKPVLKVPTLQPQVSVPSPPPPPPPPPSQPLPPPPQVIPIKKTPNPHSPPLPPNKKIPRPPPPPPPPPERKIPGPPPLPPIPTRRKPAAPPPPPKAGGLVSALKPPPVPRGKMNSNNRAEASTEGSSKGTDFGQMKLKPLHWDKVIANVDHSIVWDEINDGSFR